MIIRVTDEDIEKGVRYSCHLCPIALAVWRQLGGFVKVGPFTLEINGRQLGLPIEAQNFVFAYDEDYTCEPFEFEIDT